MSKSAEAAVLETVIEGDIRQACNLLSAPGAFLDTELTGLAGALAQTLDLVNAEIANRRNRIPARRPLPRPAADTGSINIIRGRD